METGSFLLFWIALILIAISTVFGLVPAPFVLNSLEKHKDSKVQEPPSDSWPVALFNRPPPSCSL